MNRRRAQSGSSNHSSDLEEQGYRSHRGSIDETYSNTPGHTAASGINATSSSAPVSSTQFKRESLGVIFEDKEDDGAVYNPVFGRDQKQTISTPSTSHQSTDSTYSTVPTSTSTSASASASTFKYEV